MSQTIQSGTIAPAVLTLDPEAFNRELNALIPPGKLGWSGDNHMELLARLLLHLKDASGAPATLPPALKNILTLIVRPTQDIARDVMRHGFAQAGFVLDAETEQILVLMFSSPQFADFLAATENPMTKKPFIAKEKKRGVKKSKFAALITAPTPGGAPVKEASANAKAEAPAEVTPAASEEKTVEQPPVTPTPDTQKPEAAK